MKVAEIKREASKKSNFNRFQAMLVYGALYTIVLNLYLIAFIPTFNGFPFMIIYSAALLLALTVFLGPVNYSLTNFYLNSYKKKYVEASRIFDGFAQKNFSRALTLWLQRTGLTILWSLLFIVPGVIYAHRTSMAMYILRANPEMGGASAIKNSKKIMKGNTFDYFKLNLTFMGWFLLCVVTLGLGFIFILPYFYTAKIVFYKRVLQGDTKQYGQDDDDFLSSEERELKKYEDEIKEVERQTRLKAEEIKSKKPNLTRKSEEGPPTVQTTIVSEPKEKVNLTLDATGQRDESEHEFISMDDLPDIFQNIYIEEEIKKPNPEPKQSSTIEEIREFTIQSVEPVDFNDPSYSQPQPQQQVYPQTQPQPQQQVYSQPQPQQQVYPQTQPQPQQQVYSQPQPQPQQQVYSQPQPQPQQVYPQTQPQPQQQVYSQQQPYPQQQTYPQQPQQAYSQPQQMPPQPEFMPKEAVQSVGDQNIVEKIIEIKETYKDSATGETVTKTTTERKTESRPEEIKARLEAIRAERELKAQQNQAARPTASKLDQLRELHNQNKDDGNK